MQASMSGLAVQEFLSKGNGYCQFLGSSLCLVAGCDQSQQHAKRTAADAGFRV